MNAAALAYFRKTQQIALRLAQADTVFYLLPPLMLVLIAGTLAQRWMGLFDAHHMFFSSFVIWAGPVPLPGGYMLLSVLSFSLALKFLLQSRWVLAKTGINLIHLGALILLIGGLLTSLFAREGYMFIPENHESPYVYDYVQREMVIYKNNELQDSFLLDVLRRNKVVGADLPFQLTILEPCENCQIIKREELPEQFSALPARSMAQFMALTPKPEEKEPEQNFSGVSFKISGLDEAQNGLYIAFEGMPKPVILADKTANYEIIFGRAQRLLPFSIRLDDFKKEVYPGLEKARAYNSNVIVKDGGVEWPSLIEMNKPLRYKGYTFYQSSFEKNQYGEATVLSVVENQGRLLPYIGTLIMTLGLLLHLFIALRTRCAS